MALETQVQETTTKTVVQEPPVKTEHPQKVYETKKVIFRAYQIIWYILGVIEVLLTFRVLLKLFAANQGSSFTSFIYVVSDPFALPFAGIFGIGTAGGSVLEWSTFVAMAVYAIVAYGIVQLLQLIKPTTPQEVSQEVDNP